MAEAGIPRGTGMGYGGCGVAVIWVWATGKSERFLVGLPRQKSEFATNSNCEPSGASSLPR